MPELHTDYHPPHIDRLRRFNTLMGMEIADPVDRVEAFKSIDVYTFLDILTASNSLLRDREHLDRWEDDMKGGMVSVQGMTPDLHPPKQAKELFKDLFEQIQIEITPEQNSIDQAALKLYFGIVGAHMFDDGNGRTARTAFHLMRHGSLPDDDQLILSRNASNVQTMCANANQEAVINLLKKAGLPADRIFERDFRAAKTENGLSANYGLSQHLRYLAIRHLRASEDPSFLEVDPPSELILKDQSDFVRQGFSDAYEQVRVDWFREFVEVPTRYTEGCIKAIEGTPSTPAQVALASV